MKLEKTKSTFNTYKKENIDISASIMKEYLQSFLKWLYVQNNEFNKYLQNNEISEYFLNELVHPVWFCIMLEKNKFSTMAAIDNYIMLYKENAGMMVESIKINPIKKLDYTIEIQTASEKRNHATEKQINYLLALNKKLKTHFEEDKFRQLTSQEASLVISLLK